MTDTTPAEVAIPPAAVAAHFVCGCSESGIRAGYKAEALGPTVAAELRRLVREVDARREAKTGQRYADGYFDGANMVRDLMADRADELDPEGPR